MRPAELEDFDVHSIALMPKCTVHHRYVLYECCGTRDGGVAERKLLSANDLPVLRAAMARLGSKGWRVRIWDEETAQYLS